MGWFDVDHKGLALLLEHRGKAFAIFELVQNCWDTGATVVDVHLSLSGNGRAALTVTDDNPDGFKDLRHAFTLFARSQKGADPTKRGRWNLGEKLVIALCEEASITSTTGTVIFAAGGKRYRSRSRREAGSAFGGTLRLTPTEQNEVARAVKTLLPPDGVVTRYNGFEIPRRAHLRTFVAALPTVVADATGVLRPTTRQTEIRTFAPLPGETPHLYEMGIPVVELNCPWHVDIQQKVPLNLDRDNVTPAYLRAVRTAVLNGMHDQLAAAESWAFEALACDNVTDAAVRSVVTCTFGKRAVIYDPSDLEATHRATAEGYAVVSGGAFSAAQWANIKRAGALRPAGQVLPSARPYTADGEPLHEIPAAEWTPGMRRTVAYARELAAFALGAKLRVTLVNDSQWPYLATYGDAGLVLNLGRLGRKWFAGDLEDIDALLIHELAHEHEHNHLSADYYRALCRVGAKVADLWRTRPEVMARYLDPAAWTDAACEGGESAAFSAPVAAHTADR